jgi:hypothetical protein
MNHQLARALSSLRRSLTPEIRIPHSSPKFPIPRDILPNPSKSTIRRRLCMASWRLGALSLPPNVPNCPSHAEFLALSLYRPCGGSGSMLSMRA